MYHIPLYCMYTVERSCLNLILDDMTAGLSWFVRMMAARGKPDTEWVALEIGSNGEPALLQLRNLSQCKPSSITFRIGEVFEDEAFDGRKILVSHL